MTNKTLYSRFVLVGLVALFLTAEFVRPARSPNLAPSDPSDDQLFEAVIARVRAGEPYYPVMGTELRARHYPTASPFNWRTPLLFRLMAVSPPWLWSLAISALSLAVLVLTVLHVNRIRAVEIVPIAIVTQVGALRLMLAPTARVQTEVWCGLLIAISVLAYTRRAPTWGVFLGALALFVRELAAPYCVMCILLAARGRRTRELIMWAGAAVAYAAFYFWHVLRVWSQYRPGDGLPLESWIQFGGLPFVVETIQKTNAILVLSPHVLAVTVVVLLVAALWAPVAPVHLRGAVVTFFLLFAVVGQPFNHYWGFITSPTYAIAAAYGPIGIRRLMREAFQRRTATA